MPFSIDPQPAENETQCARCGAIFHIELTRCPECGINLYEPEVDSDDDEPDASLSQKRNPFVKIGDFVRKLSGKPYSAKEVFGDALDQAILYDDLLAKVGKDHGVVERLVSFEKEQRPNGNRLIWLQNAIQRWERNNRIRGKNE